MTAKSESVEPDGAMNGEHVPATEREEGTEQGHSVWPISERVRSLPQADVVAEALRGFHQPYDETGLLPRHNGTWHDSLALTHCLCWGAAWRMLDYLLAHPDQFEALREATDG